MLAPRAGAKFQCSVPSKHPCKHRRNGVGKHGEQKSFAYLLTMRPLPEFADRLVLTPVSDDITISYILTKASFATQSLCLPPQYSTLKVGLSSGRQRLRSYSRVVEMSACPSHSCTLAISAPWAKALVAAVARSECT